MLNLGTVGIDVDEIAHWQVFDHLYEPCAIMAENPVMVITLKSGEKI